MTAVATTIRRPLCAKCGRPAREYARTLDPRYPLVSCSRLEAGEEKGCGVQLGSYDDERVRLDILGRQIKTATANHRWHLRNQQPNPRCEHCHAEPPAGPVKVHGYEDFRTRYAVASHLDIAHHDRSLLPGLTTRRDSELAHHHRKLHEAMP